MVERLLPAPPVVVVGGPCELFGNVMRLWYVMSPAPPVVMWMVMLKSQRRHIEVSYVFYNAFVK